MRLYSFKPKLSPIMPRCPSDSGRKVVCCAPQSRLAEIPPRRGNDGDSVVGSVPVRDEKLESLACVEPIGSATQCREIECLAAVDVSRNEAGLPVLWDSERVETWGNGKTQRTEVSEHLFLDHIDRMELI